MNQSERRVKLIEYLLNEDSRYGGIPMPVSSFEQKELLRALMNVRPIKEISEEFLEIQDDYLKEAISEKGVIDLNSLQPINPGLYLWQGDITLLRCDAIVNAANSGMTGCYSPNHACIDNCIHTYSGVQLRLDCGNIMKKQGHPEPTGKAKITKAYNLPSKYILHTVGPIIEDQVTESDRKLLSSCYTSCLELAAENNLESVAFCCISTGVFHFPNELAAEIAVHTVKKFMERETSVKKVIFNVFKDYDKGIYLRLLKSENYP